MGIALAWETVAAFVVLLTFIGYYSTLKWERTSQGRSIMSSSFSTFVLACCALAQRYDELHPDVDWRDDIRPFLILAWALVIALTVWQIRVLRISKRRAKRRRGRGDQDEDV